MANEPTTERRRCRRTGLVLKVTYPDRPEVDYLTDLSPLGLFVCTQRSFEVGQPILLFVSFPGLLEPLAMSGIVRWGRSPGFERGEQRAGAGVELKPDSTPERELLARVLEGTQAGPSGPLLSVPRPFNVLLVEDNIFTQELFGCAIERLHGELGGDRLLGITSAVTAQQAFERLQEGPIDLAIVDYYLPVMPGPELVRRFRGDSKLKCLPTLVVSAGGESLREDVLAAGADMYIDKPILLKQLVTTLKLLLTSARAKTTPGGDQ